MAFASASAARTALALVGSRARDTAGGEPTHAAHRVEARATGHATVDHHGDPIDGQRSFSNAGGQYHLAPAGHRGSYGEVLFRCGQVAIERPQVRVGRQSALLQRARHPADFRGAWEKHQHVAFARLRQHFQNFGGDFAQWVFWCARGVMHRHRETAASGSNARCRDATAAEQTRHGFAIERGRHDDQFEMRGQCALRFECQCQSQVGVQAAFVEFVEEKDGDVFQRGVVLQQARKQAFGDDLDTCACGHLAVEAHAVPNGLAHGLAKGRGHAYSHGARSQPPGLQHQDAAVAAPRGIEERQRHHGALAGAGRGLEHYRRVFGQRGQQCGQGLDNRQGGQ